MRLTKSAVDPTVGQTSERLNELAFSFKKSQALAAALARYGRPEIFNSERASAIGPSDRSNQGSLIDDLRRRPVPA